MERPSSLVQGCNIISRRQRYMQVVTGYLYQFNSSPPHRPRPLRILVVLINCLPPALLIVVGALIYVLMNRVKKDSPEMISVTESVFINQLAKIFAIYRVAAAFSNVVILLAQHGSMANTIASSNYYVTEREQANFANQSFMFYLVKSIAGSTHFLAVLSLFYFKSTSSMWWNCVAILVLYLIILVNMMLNSPLVYTCYLGSALGKHVENFSRIYIDTMFDQFMKAIEKEDDSELSAQARSLTFFDTHASESNGEANTDKSNSCCLRFCGHLVKVLVNAYSSVRTMLARLNMRKYPELPEMKMTKLSSTTNIQISETMRTANSHLIRVRLRKTQIMLSELRDLVSDINKTSSPIILMYLAYETILIIMVTTASIQAKVYKSIDVLILPSISITLGLMFNVIYLCTCLDETTKQLKLLINKLFDFIIMNHRIKSTGKRANSGKEPIDTSDSEFCPMSGSEYGAINETWSQFQYTRKLANTIHFTMGGILPVTRRLVLSILGHVLSAVFISIEIMSIIDTLNTPHIDVRHHASPATNTTSTHYDARDLQYQARYH